MSTLVFDSPSHLFPASHFDTLEALEKGYWWYEARIRWVCQFVEMYLPLDKRKLHMDLGAGTGGFALALSRKLGFADTWAIDNHPVAQARLKMLGLEVKDVDLDKPFQLEESADLVTFMDVLEHLEKDGDVLKRTYQQIRAGGVLVISVPFDQKLFSNWDTLLGHYRRYGKKQLADLLEETGFEILTLRTMWSFLYPVAWVRKLKEKKDTEFPKVSYLLNSLLLFLSKMEFLFPPLPFGTSLIAVARKK
jgi:2-polyprenyl-3-methyl-5-hydroxy-6-metoxy-1,4-benzoquinol methylase